jgi:hypothetical protein
MTSIPCIVDSRLHPSRVQPSKDASQLDQALRNFRRLHYLVCPLVVPPRDGIPGGLDALVDACRVCGGSVVMIQ